jgi:hypothetical protein
VVKKLKRRVYLWLSGKNGDSKMLHKMQKINQILFHWDDRMHMTHPGAEEPEKTYYVIRPASKAEGLLSLYFNSGVAEIQWAQENGYIPYIDFDTENCQYHVERKVNGTTNAWEYYFNQPNHLTANEIAQKRNVLLSGWSQKKRKLMKPTIENVQTDLFRSICLEKCAVNESVLKMADKIAERQLKKEKTLGVFIRGTDYVALQPKGHYRQPTVEQVMEKVDEFCTKYDIQKILVVTEDFEIFQKFKNKYGEMAFSSDDDFVKNYSATDYVENSFQNDPYERGLKYLIRLLLLTKCDYLVSSITNGSMFVLAGKKEAYKEQYLFDLGRYE